MTATSHLALPFIEAAQAQKHVTHNEALRILDAAIQIAVLDRSRTAPPAGPADGQRHIVATSPSGAFAGHAQAIATWQDGAWAFLSPQTGWCVWSIADGALVVFDGTAWRDTRGTALDNLVRLGIGTTASAPNLLSVVSNAALLAALAVANGGSGDIRLQLSKEAAAKTASLVFSDAFSGRAEFGLAGDDDFRVKVSPNGSSWVEALRIDRATGRVAFPAMGGPREQLTAARIYYVRPDGNDANGGLVNTSGGAFLTIQKAVDTVCALDLATFQATVQLADGTYGTGALLKAYLGALPPLIKGNATTPASVLVATVNADCFFNDGGGQWIVTDLKMTTTTGGRALAVRNGAILKFANVDFGACATWHIQAYPNSMAQAVGNYAVSGSAQYHILANGYVDVAARAVTFSGTPDFAGAFVLAGRGAVVDCYSMSFAGAGGVTGPRYAAYHNGVIFTNGGGATYLPGNAAGAVSSGLYV